MPIKEEMPFDDSNDFNIDNENNPSFDWNVDDASAGQISDNNALSSSSEISARQLKQATKKRKMTKRKINPTVESSSGQELK